ncbi:MAG: sulfatase-like hydrolase/transferase [Opitutaceae bacterium]|jgi:arylsulfatase A-like enzyme|nr:sulfatase-like hydrolase/transferase [Opitutaceae bacterium]
MRSHPYGLFTRLLRGPVQLLTLALAFLSSLTAERPNIVFILTDDQRYETLGVTGDKFISTPHLDQLAADGVLFANASVNSAICTPSRACYFLGQYERRHGVNFNSGTAMAPEAWAESYPIKLREAGYFTGYVGKNHVPIGNQAYDTGIIDNSFDYWYAGHGHLRFYPKERHEIFRHAEADTQIEIVSEGVQSFLNSADGFITGAKSFLDQRPDDQPFALSIALNLPHGSSTGTMQQKPTDPELYRTAYRDRLHELNLPSTYIAKDRITVPKLPANVLYANHRQVGYNEVDDPDEMKDLKIRETQTITGIDQFVGAIRDTLVKLGVADNTIIVFTSDHGIMHGEFGLGGKALNYETCLKVPLIIYDPRDPAAARGRRSMALTESVDIAPTLLDYAGVNAPDTMQGLSLRPLVDGRADDLRTSSFAENLWSTYFGNPRIESVRTKEWKYIRYFKNDRTQFANVTKETQYVVTASQADHYAKWLTASIKGEQPVYEELFHLASDPKETTNLASRPAYAAKLAELRSECQRLVIFAKGDINTPPATVLVPGIKEGTTKKKS